MRKSEREKKCVCVCVCVCVRERERERERESVCEWDEVSEKLIECSERERWSQRMKEREDREKYIDKYEWNLTMKRESMD